jgi:hypothetical protein
MLHIHLTSVPGARGQLLADMPSGLSLTPPHKLIEELHNLYSSLNIIRLIK